MSIERAPFGRAHGKLTPAQERGLIRSELERKAAEKGLRPAGPPVSKDARRPARDRNRSS